MMLASVVGSADDIGTASRIRIEQILGEARWMRRLLRAYEAVRRPSHHPAGDRPVRVDRIASEVVAGLRLAAGATMIVRAETTWADVDELGLWRSLRNIVDNARRAVGPNGRVVVRVRPEQPWVVLDVDDDGPGFGAGPAGLASLGLGIVRDFLAQSGGVIHIGESDLGGTRVRIQVPAAAPPCPDSSLESSLERPGAKPRHRPQDPSVEGPVNPGRGWAEHAGAGV